jgi:hypothetical protein
MSIETDVQAIVSNLQTRATAVIGTASALEQQVNNQPPVDTTTIVIDANTSVTISVGSNSITITNSAITISGSAVALPASSTMGGKTIATIDQIPDTSGFVTTTDFTSHTSDNDAHGGHYVPPSGNT